MNLEQERREELLILRPRGRLDSSSSPELERILLEQLDAGAQRLVVTSPRSTTSAPPVC